MKNLYNYFERKMDGSNKITYRKPGFKLAYSYLWQLPSRVTFEKKLNLEGYEEIVVKYDGKDVLYITKGGEVLCYGYGMRKISRKVFNDIAGSILRLRNS